MRSFLLFTRKELVEQVKAWKGVALAGVLLLFSMMSPLMAKLLPQMLSSMDLGMEIKIPTPTALDAWAEFFKNVGQIGLLVLLFTTAGSIANETSRGTASLLLTKRLRREDFVLAKFTAALCVWTVSYAAAAGVCAVYTNLLFPSGQVKCLFGALCCLWAFGALLTAGAVFASALFRSYLPAALCGFAVWGVLLLSSALPHVRDYTPDRLEAATGTLTTGVTKLAELRVPFLLCGAAAVLLLLLACLRYRRMEL